MRNNQRGTSARSRGFSTLGLFWLIGCCSLSAFLFFKGMPEGEKADAPRAAIANTPKYKNIEDIKVGDYVIAKDPDDPGPPKPHKVIGLPRNYTFHITHVSVTNHDGSTGEVQATREHPFFTKNRGWLYAKDLRTGDSLEDPNGASVIVATSRTEDREVKTYNLTVEGVHTFYVQAGAASVLVHNADSPGGENPYPDPAQPNYNNGAVQMDHEDAVVWGGTSANRPLPAETNMRRGGFDGALYKDYQKLIDQGMSPQDARSAVQSEIDALKNSPPPRSLPNETLDKLPAPCK